MPPPDILPEPPAHLKRHSARLQERIRAQIERHGPIPFSRFMEMALYEPGLGYYSAGLHKFGAEGDFVTAPELGGLFAACLARQVAEVAAELGGFEVLEIGAGSGRLAAQLLTELREEDTLARYSILERSADLRRVQEETIGRDAPGPSARVRWLDQPPSAAWTGIIIANEVIDALAVERFRIDGDEVRQVCVGADDGGLRLCDRPAPPELARSVKALGPLPDGYRSEINLRLAAWLQAVSAALNRGVALFIDYGYPRGEFYLPERGDGTLIAHYRHRAHDDVLHYPGLQDLTAFVDFTALAEAGHGCDMEVLGYTSQAMFLMGCGLEDILAGRLGGQPAQDMALNNEVRRLTLPGMMGERFQVMALGRGWPGDSPLRGFALRDLRHRL